MILVAVIVWKDVTRAENNKNNNNNNNNNNKIKSADISHALHQILYT